MAARSVRFAFILFFAANGLFLVQAADRKLSSGEFSANVKGNSGKVEFVRRGSDRRFDFSKAFTLEVDYVIQRDKDNKDVGKAVNNLASQVFSFSDLDEDTVYQNISAVNLNLDSYLTAAQATLKLEIYIFKDDGNVTFGDEIFQVQNGTLKLLIKLENYTFCEGSAVPSICKKDDIGKYVDVAIVVKSKGGKKASKRGDGDKRKIRCLRNDKCPDVYGFGDEAEMALTKTLIRDGMNDESPMGYPKADTQGSKQRFIFRARKFNHTVVFDPTLIVNEGEDEAPIPTDPSSQASSIQFSIALFVILLIALFM